MVFSPGRAGLIPLLLTLFLAGCVVVPRPCGHWKKLTAAKAEGIVIEEWRCLDGEKS